jgi:hypothetical protein
MFRPCAVVDVALGERTRRRENGRQIGQPADHDRERGHEFAALLGHVALEQRPDRRGDLEQPIVEDFRRLVAIGATCPNVC